VNIDLAQSLCEGLGTTAGDVVSISGAGGKTSLMYALGRELAGGGGRPLLTTTTRMIYPKTNEVARVLVGGEDRRTLADVRAALEGPGPVLAGREKDGEKLLGFSAAYVDSLRAEIAPATLVVECDGAMGKSLKAPRGWEPVLPSTTTVHVVVVGADCLGKPLRSGLVFEPEALAGLVRVGPDAIVDPLVAARTLLAPGSYAERTPETSRFCVFINKWDAVREGASGSRAGEDPAMGLALELKKSDKVERVVLASLKAGSREPMMVIR
jgi:probable selenium-dependent hydroxylase accessory protein YqeC